MHALGLLAGIFLIYVLPGAAIVSCLLGTQRRWWPSIPFFSIIGIGLTYSVPGLIYSRSGTADSLMLSPALTAIISLSIALLCGIVVAVRKGQPLLELGREVSTQSVGHQRIMAILVVANVLAVTVGHISNLLGRMPNVTDTISRVNMVLMVQLTGITPRHWLQPTADLINYFYTYVPAAALSQFGGYAVSVPVAWWIHATLQVIGYSAVAVWIFSTLSRNAKWSFWLALFFFLCTNFGLISNLAFKSGHLPVILKNWHSYSTVLSSTVLSFGSGLGAAMWIPQHVVCLVGVLLLPILRWRVTAPVWTRVILSALLLTFLAGGSTFLFVSFCAGLALWIALHLMQRQWDEVKYWTASCVLAAPFILPFYRYISGHAAGGGLRFARYPLEITSIPGINYVAGFGLELVFLVVQMGFASVALWLMWQAWKKGWRPDAETSFYLVTGLFMVVFLLSITSSTGPGDLNNLGARGLMIPQMYFLLAAVIALKPENVWPSAGWKRGLIGALAVFSLTPALYGFAGSMNFLRKMPAIPAVVRWANAELPRDAVVIIDNAVLNDHSMKYWDTYGRCRWSWIERRKWNPGSQLTYADKSSIDMAQALEVYPQASLSGLPRYLFRFRASPAPAEAETVYQDAQFALDRLP
jgi:hypothetical protein